MAVQRDLPDDAKETSRRTQRDNELEVSLCERSLQHVFDGFNRLKRPFSWEERSGTILSLAALAANSLVCSFELLLKGYYLQANTLSRSAWESWLNGAYLHLYQDRAVSEWSEFPSRPKPWEMRKLVAERATESTDVDSEELRAAMDTMYIDYSGESHPSGESLRSMITKIEGEVSLRLGPNYDDVLVKRSVNFFCIAASMVGTLFDFLPLDDAEYQEAAKRLSEDVAIWRENDLAAFRKEADSQN